ncbi:hypothetical protein PIB30_002922 [Stylosanthes scabra]|uniref:Uncharacterized protein n=1 Tax=Stylosanthes scabra TaxID=79078 RepID=A0ABU6V1E2_9FABA|nr:hypothetical protein [Stylosanthes scabra]
MRCTLFGELVKEVAQLLHNEDAAPLILVAQFFKPSVYLNEGYIQNIPHVSQVYINPDYEDVATFKRSLLRDREAASQRITHVESQSQYFAGDELSGGDYRIVTFEDVFNMTEETRCWVLAEVVSIEAGAEDWCYATCNDCKTKLEQIKSHYVCDDCGRGFNKPPLRL